jgi:hypothetical protein
MYFHAQFQDGHWRIFPAEAPIRGQFETQEQAIAWVRKSQAKQLAAAKENLALAKKQIAQLTKEMAEPIEMGPNISDARIGRPKQYR